MSVLSEHLVLARTRNRQLADVKSINLCTFGLTDVGIFARMPRLEIANLTNNCLTSLKPFENLTNLHELYLRSNQIADINELRYLARSPLRILCLKENPCYDNTGPQYRRMVIQRLPNLEVLDYVPVQDAERRREIPLARAVENVAATPRNNAIPDVVDRPRLRGGQQPQQQAASSEQAQPEPCMPARSTARNNVAQPELNFAGWSAEYRNSRRSQTPRRQLRATPEAAPLAGANEVPMAAPPSARARRFPSAPGSPRASNLELWGAGPSNSQAVYSTAQRSGDYFVPVLAPQPREHERRRRNPINLQAFRFANAGSTSQSSLLLSIGLIAQELDRNTLEVAIDALIRRLAELSDD